MDSPDNVLYYDRHMLLVINTAGKLRRLYTPFRVQCIKAVGPIKEGSMLFVEELTFCDDSRIVHFRINRLLFPHQYFAIRIGF